MDILITLVGMKRLILYLLIFVMVTASCGKPTKDAVPADIVSMIKRYPKLFPYNFDNYQFVREVFTSDSLRMRLYNKENTGDQVVEFINKAGKSYAFPIPTNSDSTYWKFYGDTSRKFSGDRNFESELQRTFKVLSLDEGWLAERIFQNLTVSLLQTRIVMRSDSYSQTHSKSDTSRCGKLSQESFRIMYGKSRIVIGLTANTFYDYDHGRYYQFESNMPNGKRDFTIIVYRDPCWVQPGYL